MPIPVRRTYVSRTPSTPTPRSVAAERASRGAALLDAEVPGWADIIDLDALDVGEMEVAEAGDLQAQGGCVLCQVDLAITEKTPTSKGCAIARPGQTAEDLQAEAQFYEEQRRLTADIERDHADGEGERYAGSYVRLAADLGLDRPAAKAAHGFLNDGKTTYPELDAAWTAEIQQRRGDA